MKKLTRDDLLSLEQYSAQRDELRKQVMAHKKNRQVPVGPNATLYFEDETTIRYQIQEMLRAEKIFDAEGIAEELDSYNPLIPDGTNLKATMMLEYSDPQERARELAKLIGVDRQTWLQVAGFDKVYPITNEDLERETEEKTSSVHFLRFELSDGMIMAAKEGAKIALGISHDHYNSIVDELPQNIHASLVSDLG